MCFVDQPVAGLLPRTGRWRFFFQLCAAPSLLALPVAGICMACAVLARLRGTRLPARVWLVSSVATLAGTAAKDELKWIFGRPWPGTWLHNGIYGFHPFADQHVVRQLSLRPYRLYFGAALRPLGAGAALPRPLRRRDRAGHVRPRGGADYHFVGDVLGGLLTGMACAWGSLVLMKPRDA